MKIAVIGTGNVGSILGTRLAHQGHEVIFGSRDPRAAKVVSVVQSAGPNARADANAAAVKSAEVIILTVPYSGAEETIKGLGPLQGKILIDTTNALLPDLSGLSLPAGESAGENVAGWAAGARVVKAFNTIGTKVMEDPAYGDDRALLLICGDSAGAKATAADLADELGFNVVDAGPLSMARHLESLAMLWIQLAFVQGKGTDFALKILTR
ncbi:MAG: NADPH-dependent F420 reductase [Candidatus Omnitrophica bacterium]|nr:NADPH-dependent F420 reductase [Candidatus Omnitrophota bacterium]MCB9720014.1 NADPH-dependent F420 reductase [Candidatus Omnitrophota bacterium]